MAKSLPAMHFRKAAILAAGLLRRIAQPALSRHETLLFSACRNGQPGLAQECLDNGARVGSRDLCGQTPLHAACDAGEYGCAQTLLRNGANPSARDERGQTPLHCAA